MTPPGDQEVRIEGDRRLVSGECAAGDGAVREDEASVVRFHPTERGGLFHARCAPTDPAWYALEDTGGGAGPVRERVCGHERTQLTSGEVIDTYPTLQPIKCLECGARGHYSEDDNGHYRTEWDCFCHSAHNAKRAAMYAAGESDPPPKVDNGPQYFI